MFDTVVLGRSCPKKEYETYAPHMRMKLFQAQRICRDRKIPLLIIISGVDGAGRGAVMNLLSEWMDGKFLHNFVFWQPTDDERERPLEWRFWRCLPGKGETSVFFDGWYGSTMRQHCCGELDAKEFLSRMYEFKGLEESLALSGMAIVKIWLHLDRKTHDKRLKNRLEHKTLRHFTPYDKKTSGNYDALVAAASQGITLTDRNYAPWTIIDAADANFRNLAVAKAIVDTVNRVLPIQKAREAGLKIAAKAEEKLEQASLSFASPEAHQVGEAADATAVQDQKDPKKGKDQKDGFDNAHAADTAYVPTQTGTGMQPIERRGFLATVPLTTLEAIDLSPTIAQDEYKKELKKLQEELQDLTYQAYKNHISSTLIFEGMDAAGKGGTIRRLLAGVDARISRVIPISSPSDEELAHHYLWRFWRHIPRSGFVTIYDRSWYGRVLVERVEELTPRRDWSRAYEEINHFEHQLTKNNNILLKFWLHISSEEELRRFKERENTPWKRYKITPEDWRNREKWDQYLVAADEMFLRTSTAYAPWHILSAEDKKYARVTALKIWRDALVRALEAAKAGEK